MLDFDSKVEINRKEFGERIKKARKGKKITQEVLCSLLEIDDRSTISSWENGKTLPEISKIPNLCSKLEIDAGYLFGEYTERNIQIHDICNITGLSKDAVEKLIEWKKGKNKVNSAASSCWVDYLSLIITNRLADDLMYSIEKGLLIREAMIIANRNFNRPKEPNKLEALNKIRRIWVVHNSDTANIFRKIVKNFTVDDSPILKEMIRKN